MGECAGAVVPTSCVGAPIGEGVGPAFRVAALHRTIYLGLRVKFQLHAMQQIDVEVQPDFFNRLAAARPVQALAELIWNALDADAKTVKVEFDRYASGLLQQIRVVDDGHGMPLSEAPSLFQKLGGSWKRDTKRSLVEQRMLHGAEGQGRFRALALGRVVDWHVTAPATPADPLLLRYTITIIRDNPTRVMISDPTPAPEGAVRGVEVVISELFKQWRLEDDESVMNEITETLALYLTSYNKVRLSIGGMRVDAAAEIASQKQYQLTPIVASGSTAVTLDVIEWKSDKDRAIHLCTENGFPLARLAANVIAPGYSFAAYIRSAYISQLNDDNLLDMVSMVPELNAAVEEARVVLREHFKSRADTRLRQLVDEWKSEDVYPYANEPQTAIEEVERKVFDVIAVSVATALPDLQASEQKTRRWQLRMLRAAIERGPEELQLIMTEVLQLPQKKREDLARLLRRTSLSNIISASKLVTDRLEFIEALKQMLFRLDLRATFKERKQLHRILASNTWLFGEEYALTVNDQDLAEVLRKHRKVGGLENGLIDNEPVLRPEGTPQGKRRGIVDLVLSRNVPTGFPAEVHHLVIELKAPKNKLKGDDTGQIKSYAYAVSNDERFKGIKTTWNFWLVSNDLTPFVENEMNNGQPRGVLQRMTLPDGGSLTIHVRRWSELLHEAQSRLEFIQKELNYEVNRDEALAQLRSTYAEILGGPPEPAEDSPSGDDDEDDDEGSVDTETA